MIAKKSLTKFNNLKVEKEIRRSEIIQELKDNFSFFNENEDCDVNNILKDELSKIEKELISINDILFNNNIIDTSTIETDVVVFGSIVTLLDLDSNEEFKYQILSSDEIDLKNGIISLVSPMGSALMGKEIDDQLVVGEREYEIINISKD